jgi:hypothetical protein
LCYAAIAMTTRSFPSITPPNALIHGSSFVLTSLFSRLCANTGLVKMGSRFAVIKNWRSGVSDDFPFDHIHNQLGYIYRIYILVAWSAIRSRYLPNVRRIARVIVWGFSIMKDINSRTVDAQIIYEVVIRADFSRHR